MKTAKIRVPASTANLGPAFDAVGLAVRLYLETEIRLLPRGPSRVEARGIDAHLIPTDESNLIWRTMRNVAERVKLPLPPFALRIDNRIPITKGLGSSSSACLAGVAGADFLCGLGMERESWLGIAADIEGHPDNAAPSLYGGLVASIKGEKIFCARAEFPLSWTIVAVIPGFELQTRAARAVLPRRVSHEDAVHNVQCTAFLMTQLIQGRSDGLRAAMADRLHQPYRCALIPGLRDALEMEQIEGLLGLALSGAGPTVIAIADGNEDVIGERLCAIFAQHGVTARAEQLKADTQGLVMEIEEY